MQGILFNLTQWGGGGGPLASLAPGRGGRRSGREQNPYGATAGGGREKCGGRGKKGLRGGSTLC